MVTQIFFSNIIEGQDLAKSKSYTFDNLPKGKQQDKEHVSSHLFKREATLEHALTGEAHDHAFTHNAGGPKKLDQVKEEEESVGFFGKIINFLGCGSG